MCELFYWASLKSPFASFTICETETFGTIYQRIYTEILLQMLTISTVCVSALTWRLLFL